ncbi:hypothetical protein HMPREF9713_01772 [Myroides odoratimimus CCUG 12700]|uniref:OsmC family peroxiredoxin n=1 Tax=Myroides odoratimimus TaxID=76832 RepID=UPI0003542F66|nr:OsmC family peroxiredoxin [Myroides odoratimimus]EPH11286.1 hypothetical protein HMPREF9713_01772 [Myroides odoratimimus CCUG 12700]
MKVSIKAIWRDDLKQGKGNYVSDNQLLNQMDYSFSKQKDYAVTLPEEMIAAAYSACFNMTLTLLLTQGSYKIEELETNCEITYNNEVIVQADLEIMAVISGLDNTIFQQVVAQAKQMCPIGNSFNFPTIYRALLK